MCGIGSLVSSWNASQRAIRSEFQHNGDHRMGASGLASALQESAGEAPQETGGTAGCCASLLNPASMAALIVEQTRCSARASLGAFLMSQADGSGCEGPAGAQDVFSALDSDADGMISRAEFDAALNGSNEPEAATPDQTDVAAPPEPGATDQNPVATSESAAAEAPTSPPTAEGNSASTPSSVTTSETVNPDGSTSTTLTYPDGATVTFTTPPAPNAEAGGDDSAAPTFAQLPIESVLATLIRLQAHLMDATAG